MTVIVIETEDLKKLIADAIRPELESICNLLPKQEDVVETLEAAHILGYRSPKPILAMVAQGKLKPYGKCKKPYKFLRSVVEQMKNEREGTTGAEIPEWLRPDRKRTRINAEESKS